MPRVFCSRACYGADVRAKGRKGRPQSVEVGTTYVSNEGYVLERVATDHPVASAKSRGWVPQHRLAMAEMLGRPLLPSENVHHKNGVRSDNRPENLELWSRTQPQGQRVVDLLAWAREIVATYEPVEARLS